MTHFGLSPDLTRRLCWALLHFLWQGGALALLLAAALAVVRRAAVRYALGVGTLVLMLAAPIATFVAMNHPARSSEAQTSAAVPGMLREALASTVTRAPGQERGAVPSGPSRHGAVPSLPPGSYAWLLEFWLAGVALLSVRALGGFCLLERIRRRETISVGADLEAVGRTLERRLGLGRAIRYCQSRQLDAPAVIGWLRPVVLLPAAALTGLSPSQLRAVIAHELSHIRRHDAFVNLFQTGAETLLFYHPAVWWVSARIRAEREHCCDDVAVSVCDGVPDYARALMLMEERARRAAPRLALAANGSPLRTRIRRLLGLETRPGGARGLGFAAASLCLALVLLAGTGLLGTAQSSNDAAAGAREATGAAASAPLTPVPQVARLVSTANNESIRRSLRATRVAAAVRAITNVHLAAVMQPAFETAEVAGQEATETGKESYIAGLDSVGLKNLSADQLIGLKVQGVTPEYVRQIRAAGLNPSVDELIGMKVQGVTPDYIRGLRADGFNPTVDEVIGMRVQRVTPEYVKAMRAAGLKPSPEELIGMKVQGVTPEYLGAMRAAGVDLTAEEAIAMRVQGVTPEYVREMHAAGLKPAADDLIAMKVQGVTPEYISDMHSAGLTPTADQLIALRTQGVTPEFVRALQGSGLAKLSTNDYIAAKVMGITPEFVEKARSHGIQGLTLDKLIALKQAGVF